MSGADWWSSSGRRGRRSGILGPALGQECQEWPAFAEPAAVADCGQAASVAAWAESDSSKNVISEN